MTDNLRLSVSKTKTFLDCKAKYKFAYIDKLPRKTWDFHTFGKFCHKVLEDFHNFYIEGSQEQYNVSMSKAFKSSVELYKPDMTPEMKKECWDIINQYLKIVTQLKKENKIPNIIACEKNFEFNVGDGVTKNVILNGMIDRIQVDDDNVVHVCDYKTVKNKKYLKNDFFQLLTYAHVIVNEDPNIDVVRASYILLRHNFEYITVEFKKPEILSIKDKYLNYAQNILDEKEFKPNPTNLCRFCDYVNLCPEGNKIANPAMTYGEVEW